jgi:hypothetical protein
MKLATIAGVVPVTAALLSGACSSQMQRSVPLGQDYLRIDALDKGGVKGLPYYLPDTVLPVTISGDFVLLPERKDNKPPKAQDYEYVVVVTIGTTKQVADPNAPLMLEYRPEAGTNDTFKLAVGTNGLLSTVNSTSEDQTAAIIVKLAELAKEGLRAVTAVARNFAAAPGSKPEVTPDQRREACFATLQKMSVTAEVNLSDLLLPAGGADTSALREQAAKINAKAVRAMQKDPPIAVTQKLIKDIDLETKAPPPVRKAISDLPNPGNPTPTAHDGIVFRLMTPGTFSLDIGTAGLKFGDICELRSEASSVDNATVMVADPRRTFVVDNSRTAFVKKKVNMTVTDGVLTGIDVDKPSELLAAISLPVDVLKVIASIPGEILSVKVKQLSDQNNLSAAQVKMLELQIDMIKQRQALIDAQNGTTK